MTALTRSIRLSQLVLTGATQQSGSYQTKSGRTGSSPSRPRRTGSSPSRPGRTGSSPSRPGPTGSSLSRPGEQVHLFQGQDEQVQEFIFANGNPDFQCCCQMMSHETALSARHAQSGSGVLYVTVLAVDKRHV